MKKIISSAAILLLSSAVGFAADLPLKARPLAVPIAPPVYNWTGWYVGVHVGGFWGDTSNNLGLPNVSASSAFAGVQGGYRYQFANNVVLGIQVSAPLWASDQNKAVTAAVINTATFKGSILGQ